MKVIKNFKLTIKVNSKSNLKVVKLQSYMNYRQEKNKLLQC